MKMSNSSLVTYKHIVKNKTSGRSGNKIQKIFVHHMAGNLTVKQCGSVFDNRQASAHYGINGVAIGQYVDEKDTAWHCGNFSWNQKSIGIELANDGGSSTNWHVADKTIETAIKLIADICKRNGIERLTYTGNMNGNLCMHKWVASTSCPGGYLTTQFARIANGVNELLGAKSMLEVDGVGGPLTVIRMQQFLGTTVDGVISGQNKAYSKYFPALTAVEYDDTTSTCVKALQWLVGVYEDGIIGPDTVKAWQKFIGVGQDGIFGPHSMKTWQKYLNEHDKAVFPSTHAPKPVEPVTTKPSQTTTATTSKMDKALAWSKKTADSKAFHYVKWQQKVTATHECPICKKHSKGSHYGGNCIWWPFASWHHGAGLANKCSCGVITNQLYEKMLKVSAAEAKKIAQDRIGLKDIQVLRSSVGLSTSKLKPGDVIAYFNGNKYMHTAMYVGNGKIADCTSGRTPNIKHGVNSYSKWKIRLAIRYIGK